MYVKKASCSCLSSCPQRALISGSQDEPSRRSSRSPRKEETPHESRRGASETRRRSRLPRRRGRNPPLIRDQPIEARLTRPLLAARKSKQTNKQGEKVKQETESPPHTHTGVIIQAIPRPALGEEGFSGRWRTGLPSLTNPGGVVRCECDVVTWWGQGGAEVTGGLRRGEGRWKSTSASSLPHPPGLLVGLRARAPTPPAHPPPPSPAVPLIQYKEPGGRPFCALL